MMQGLDHSKCVLGNRNTRVSYSFHLMRVRPATVSWTLHPRGDQWGGGGKGEGGSLRCPPHLLGITFAVGRIINFKSRRPNGPSRFHSTQPKPVLCGSHIRRGTCSENPVYQPRLLGLVNVPTLPSQILDCGSGIGFRVSRTSQTQGSCKFTLI